MAFRLKLSESIEDGFHRIGLEQIDRACRQLGTDADRVTSVHQTRKCLKRIRALLRLYRPVLGSERFREENGRFRDIAALLSPERDRAVVSESAAKLELWSNGRARAAFSALKVALGDAHLPAHAENRPDMQSEILARLETARQRFQRLSLASGSFDRVGEGAEMCYRRGRKAFQHAYTEPDDEHFHAWRKTVQQHWRHMMLLSAGWPEVAAARVKAARHVSVLLGDDHDLALLQARLLGESRLPLTAAKARQIAKLAKERQQVLRRAAFGHGERLFAETPEDFRRRMGNYWQAAVRIAADDLEPAD